MLSWLNAAPQVQCEKAIVVRFNQFFSAAEPFPDIVFGGQEETETERRCRGAVSRICR